MKRRPVHLAFGSAKDLNTYRRLRGTEPYFTYSVVEEVPGLRTVAEALKNLLRADMRARGL